MSGNVGRIRDVFVFVRPDRTQPMPVIMFPCTLSTWPLRGLNRMSIVLQVVASEDPAIQIEALGKDGGGQLLFGRTSRCQVGCARPVSH
jgi:hypothetical protein